MISSQTLLPNILRTPPIYAAEICTHRTAAYGKSEHKFAEPKEREFNGKHAISDDHSTNPGSRAFTYERAH